MSTFFGIEIGRRALSAQQKALEVTGHNVANANTDGYSRQTVYFATTNPYPPRICDGGGRPAQVGTGVEARYVKRQRNEFLDIQFRRETTVLGRWETEKDTLSRVEGLLLEPSEHGLQSTMDEFWQALQDLGTNPESFAVRATFVQKAAAVAETFSHIHRQLNAIRVDLDESVQAKVAQVNEITREIARLNAQIANQYAAGRHPNDLEDRRDMLVDELSRVVEVEAFAGENGSLRVIAGGSVVVDGPHAFEWEAIPDQSGFVRVLWKGTTAEARLNGGELGGLLNLRYRMLPGIADKLETLRTQFMNEVNAVHQEGYGLDGSTGLPLYVPLTGPELMGINPEIEGHPEKVGAALTPDPLGHGNPGDGQNALNMAALKFKKLEALGSTTMDDYYRSIVAELGVRCMEAERATSNQELLVLEIKGRRESVSGVSLDEEAANMIRYQHAYSAAARYVTAIDEMIDQIVNRLGIVGR